MIKKTKENILLSKTTENILFGIMVVALIVGLVMLFIQTLRPLSTILFVVVIILGLIIGTNKPLYYSDDGHPLP